MSRCSIMRNLCLLWTSILLGNYYVQGDEIYFQLLEKNQTDDKSNFYNIINFPNNSISWGDNKSSGTAHRFSEDISNTTEETSTFTEHESISVGRLSDYDKFKDTPDFNYTSPFEEWNIPENAWTPPSEYDIFKGIPDDYFKDSSNIIRVTMEIPNFDDDEYSNSVTYTNSNAKPWLRVFGILFAFITAIYGTYLRCTRKREVAETNPDDMPKTVILIMPKTEKV